MRFFVFQKYFPLLRPYHRAKIYNPVKAVQEPVLSQQNQEFVHRFLVFRQSA